MGLYGTTREKPWSLGIIASGRADSASIYSGLGSFGSVVRSGDTTSRLLPASTNLIRATDINSAGLAEQIHGGARSGAKGGAANHYPTQRPIATADT